MLKRVSIAILTTTISLFAIAGATIAGSVSATTDGGLTSDGVAIAVLRGWTVAQVQAFLRSEEAIGRVAEALAESRPEAFVGSALADDPEGAPTIYVKGMADAFVHRLAADASVPIVIADNQPYSRDELDQASAEAAAALQSLGYLDVAVYADVQARGVVRAIVKGTPTTDATDISARLPAKLRDRVEVSLSSSRWEQQAVTGGMAIGDSVGPFCTSGFTVTKTVGGVTTRGIASAGHCTGVDRILDHQSGAFTAMTFKDSHIGQWGDFNWFTTPAYEADDFYADVNELRDVSTWEIGAAISIGESVCNFGWGFPVEHVCSFVAATGTWCGVGYQVLMTTAVTDGGDSGGPWFFNNRAYGIHRGICDGRSYWSMIDHIDEGIGVKPATS